MAPNATDSVQSIETDLNNNTKPNVTYKWDIVWRNVFLFVFLHVTALIGVYHAFFGAKWQTLVWTYWLTLASTQGTGAGVHRLWAHRAYKAKLPLRILLAVYQTMCLQNHIYEWCRDHRVHHKYADTDADPHNVNRGFFFSHMGWLLVRKHRDVITKGKTIDLSDLEADPVVMFQKKYYTILGPLFAFVIPTLIPVYIWKENIYIAFCVSAMMRYTITLHGAWLVNSAAHMWGYKPYDKNIKSTENVLVSYITNGEGWHNYHHTFPWDYKAAELGSYAGNWSTAFIDLFAKIGWAYDMKTASQELIHRRAKRSGDGSRYDEKETSIWGWGDENICDEDVLLADLHYPAEDDE